jgi:hypothetical protein
MLAVWKGDRMAPKQATGDQRREENPMAPRVTRRSMAGLAVGGLVAIGGLGGVAHRAARPSSASAEAHAAHSIGAVTLSGARVGFREQMRELWEDHVAWTRLYIVSAAADLPDLELTTQRLLRNQTDIGDAVRPFYGDTAGDDLTTLLEEHITGAAALLAAAKSGDQTAVEVAGANWYVNADAIAAFLSAANPEQWPRADLEAEMRMHLDLTLEEATARLNGDFAADIAAYDVVHDHILGFADRLSEGIIAQFPDQFA